MGLDGVNNQPIKPAGSTGPSEVNNTARSFIEGAVTGAAAVIPQTITNALKNLVLAKKDTPPQVASREREIIAEDAFGLLPGNNSPKV